MIRAALLWMSLAAAAALATAALAAAARATAAAPAREAPGAASASIEVAPGDVGPAPARVLPGGCVAVVDAGVSLVCRGADGALTTRRLAEIAEARSLDPAGPAAVLVARRGGITRVSWDADGTATVTPVLEDARLGPRTFSAEERPDLDGDGTPDLAAMTFEGLARWRRTPEGFVPAGTLAVPPSVAGWEESVTLSGPALLPLRPRGARGADVPRFTWPESRPGRRLAARRLGGAPCTAWIALDDPMSAERADWARQLAGDPPRVAALLMPADRATIFGNATLMVAPLACDETARGVRPSLLVETTFEGNIGSVSLDAFDATGDGTVDVVVSGAQGFGSQRFDIAVHAGDGAGGFARKPLTRRIEANHTGEAIFTDLDHDGFVDLAVLATDRVLVYRGERGRLFPSKPAEVEIPKGFVGDAVIGWGDLDGDGHDEVILSIRENDGKGSFRVQVGPRTKDELPRAGYRLAIVRLPGPSAHKGRAGSP